MLEALSNTRKHLGVVQEALEESIKSSGRGYSALGRGYNAVGRTLHLCSVRKSDKLTGSSTVNFDKIAPWFVAGASGEGGRPWLLLPEGKRSSCLTVRFEFSTTDAVSRINPWIKLSCLRKFH